MTLLPYVDESDLPEDILAIFAEQPHGFHANSLRVMGHHPALVRAFTDMAKAIYRDGLLGRDLKALVALMRSQVSGCRYCQAHTGRHAIQHSVSDEKLDAIWEFETSSLFSDAERAALRLARDAAQIPNEVTSDHFAELQRHFSPPEIVELLAVVCFFAWLNTWNDSLATDLEDSPWLVATKKLAGSNWDPGKHRGSS